MVGLGSVIGATVLVGVLIYVLAQISFVPIVGDFVEEIVQEITPGIESSENPESTDIFDQFQQKKNEIEGR